MTLTKSSQKRLRNEEEEGEDALPRTKRREYYFNRNRFHQYSGEDESEGAGEPHHTQVASTSGSQGGGYHYTDSALHSSPHTSPLAGTATASSSSSDSSPHLPPRRQNSADITVALRNTHLDLQRYPGDATPHPQLDQRPSLLKDAGFMPLLPGMPRSLPDVVHQASEEDYYCHVNRMLRSAHFERLKRGGESDHEASFGGGAHD